MPSLKSQRPEYIDSVLGDRVFDGDEGYEELLESLVENEREAERLKADMERSIGRWSPDA